MTDSPCLVIGGSGFLGVGAVPELSQAYHVVSTSRRDRGDAYLTLDARDPAALMSAVRDVGPACVAVFAAYRDPDWCEDEPEETYRLNTEPLRVLAEGLPAEIPLLFVSTDYVFDGENPPYHEGSERNPVNVYGQSKKAAEDLVLARPRSAVLRVPLLMGWTDDPAQSGFFSHLIYDLRHEGRLPLDDVLARYPVWTRDAGVVIRTVLEKGYTGAFHLSTPARLTRYSAAMTMGELLGWDTSHIEPSSKVIPRRATRPADARLSMERWNQLEAFRPHSFREVATSFIEHFGIG